MFWKWFWRFWVFLLIVGIFAGGGIAIYKAGYTYGYTTGIWAGDADADVVTPQFYAHPRILHGGYARPMMFFPFFGLLFGFFLLLVVIGGFRRLAYHKMWHSKTMNAEGAPPHSGYWHHPYWHHRDHRCGPPWNWDEKQKADAVGKTEESGEAESEG